MEELSNLAAYRAWKTDTTAAVSLNDEFVELRRIMQEEHLNDEIATPARIDRENAFMQINFSISNTT
ncbi:MAG TPA: hypothetical protein VJ001_16685 [Rhodocyclaceae bacterium]|nr:hypothetical protein [Rhodocyclaceae bacterium]